MKMIASLSVLTFTALAATTAMAQAPKPIVKTTCADYVGMQETVKPKFVYYAVGHTKKGKKEAVFDEVAVDKIKPELDQFCAVNLTKSAYDHVMATSMASERTNK